MFKQWVYDEDYGWYIGMFTYLIPYVFISYADTKIDDLECFKV